MKTSSFKTFHVEYPFRNHNFLYIFFLTLRSRSRSYSQRDKLLEVLCLLSRKSLVELYQLQKSPSFKEKCLQFEKIQGFKFCQCKACQLSTTISIKWLRSVTLEIQSANRQEMINSLTKKLQNLSLLGTEYQTDYNFSEYNFLVFQLLYKLIGQAKGIQHNSYKNLRELKHHFFSRQTYFSFYVGYIERVTSNSPQFQDLLKRKVQMLVKRPRQIQNFTLTVLAEAVAQEETLESFVSRLNKHSLKLQLESFCAKDWQNFLLNRLEPHSSIRYQRGVDFWIENNLIKAKFRRASAQEKQNMLYYETHFQKKLKTWVKHPASAHLESVYELELFLYHGYVQGATYDQIRGCYEKGVKRCFCGLKQQKSSLSELSSHDINYLVISSTQTSQEGSDLRIRGQKQSVPLSTLNCRQNEENINLLDCLWKQTNFIIIMQFLKRRRYSVSEVSDLLLVSQGTVEQWQSKRLSCIKVAVAKRKFKDFVQLILVHTDKADQKREWRLSVLKKMFSKIQKQNFGQLQDRQHSEQLISEQQLLDQETFYADQLKTSKFQLQTKKKSQSLLEKNTSTEKSYSDWGWGFEEEMILLLLWKINGQNCFNSLLTKKLLKKPCRDLENYFFDQNLLQRAQQLQEFFYSRIRSYQSYPELLRFQKNLHIQVLFERYLEMQGKKVEKDK